MIETIHIQPEVGEVPTAKEEGVRLRRDRHPGEVEAGSEGLRSRRIAEIIRQRKSLVPQIARQEERLRRMLRALGQAVEAQAALPGHADARIRARVEALDLRAPRALIEPELAALGELSARFNRDTLHVGVVGRSRQGKSRLIQSLTGLGDQEIPTGSLGACTGTRSTIRHQESGEPYAVVTFHTPESLLQDAIAPYFEELGLGPAPRDLEAFFRQDLPEPDRRGPHRIRRETLFARLKEYQIRYSAYRELLGEAPRTVPAAEIRSYVAQDRDEYFRYLAVQSVEIFCTFPVQDIGQVALIDLPGLGELRVGNEERMLKTLAEDVDLILFVRMAKQDGTGEQWDQLDVHLYETAQRAMPHLPLERWAFLLLNHIRTAQGEDINLGLSRYLHDTLEQTRIRVGDVGVVDCASPTESGLFLDRMLDYLQHHILDIDTEYLNRRQESLRKTQRRVGEHLAHAAAVLERSNEDNREGEQFRERFRQLYRDLCHDLENVVRGLRARRDCEDAEFRASIDAIISTCRSELPLPSLDELQRVRDRLGSWAAAYDLTLGDLRAQLRRRLFVLDDALQSSLEAAKIELTRVFRETGRLRGLAPGEGSEFLQALAPRVPSDLRPAFEILARFQPSYRGLQYRLPTHLELLQPDETEVNTPKPANGEEALLRLKDLHQLALHEIEQTLKGLLTEPGRIACALGEEFLDLVIRTAEAEYLWTGFYETHRETIWQDVFGRIQETQRLLDRLSFALADAASGHHPDETV